MLTQSRCTTAISSIPLRSSLWYHRYHKEERKRPFGAGDCRMITKAGISMLKVQSHTPSQGDPWKGYRLARRSFLFSLLVGPTVIGLISARQKFGILDEWVDQLLVVVALPVPIICFASAAICHWWKCPRCRKAFFTKWWFSNDFATSCLHCGLPKWSEDSCDFKTASETSINARELDDFWNEGN